MIKKLSDEKMRQFDDDYKSAPEWSCSEKDYTNGQKKACDYYDAQIDAQIDAQAKTMEELLRMFYDISPNQEAHDFFGNNNSGRCCQFSRCVAFFLAAGGRIKE